MGSHIPESEFVARPSVCAVLGISESTFIRLGRRGEGPEHTRIGRRVLYRKSALENWLRSRQQKSTKEAQHA